MKDIIKDLIEDFLDKKLPKLKSRKVSIKEINNKVRVIIGMRRVGKTSLCYQKITHLLTQGIAREQILYLNFEDERLQPFTRTDFQLILDQWFLLYPENKNTHCYLFFDEIQNIEHWDTFVRRVVDNEDVDFFITGSSSKMLSTEIATALRGRSVSTELFPYSFKEVLLNEEIITGSERAFGSKLKAKIGHAFENYLETGGFPEVLTLSKSLRHEVLRGYVDTVVLRDVIERHNVSNSKALRSLMRLLFRSPGQQFSVNKNYNHLKSLGVSCSKNALFEYMEHLEDAYLLYQVSIFTNSEKVRQVNPQKVYFIDTGLISAMSHRTTADRGILLENLVYMELRRRNKCIEYAHTQKGHEIDFVVRPFPDSPRHEATLIQVTWDMSEPKTRERELRSLREGVIEYEPRNAIIITAYDEGHDDESGIQIIPAWRWLLQGMDQLA